ncbi:MAG: hypothetical protein A3G18_11755 [Rhodospirillales bacterium RIFCSPLOWO2_12_FULL_58_28]|nr:MAG: hypothetical protein A3H92_11945 [Rhodospirillales bacterium RIFCSPLOWO2_02_FULL_58_16]OHC77494.1 MAG: hypothetical protein A3G18_11755 [Rhodospirillales bacterium RIFCSPLOWO2_12_FULL_58_28]
MNKEKFLALGIALAVAVGSSSAFAGGPDAKKGGEEFKKKCKLCHEVAQGAKPKVGPTLFGIVGAKAGATGFEKYEALKGSDVTWDDANLDKWLTDPKAFTGKATKMTAKTAKPEDRADLIAYLKTLK